MLKQFAPRSGTDRAPKQFRKARAPRHHRSGNQLRIICVFFVFCEVKDLDTIVLFKHAKCKKVFLEIHTNGIRIDYNADTRPYRVTHSVVDDTVDPIILTNNTATISVNNFAASSIEGASLNCLTLVGDNAPCAEAWRRARASLIASVTELCA